MLSKTRLSFLQKLSVITANIAIFSVGMTSDTIAASLSDFIFVVDESGSLAGEHAWLEASQKVWGDSPKVRGQR
ncbi:hypothetical protein, partial [Crocosphaera sp. Alani8]|uniref:hypothetical protein n=1 Tax=Crocosphaera sp. Alani8 TaxID=3038952 RepID=UPI00313DC386